MLTQLSMSDVAQVGGKNASLGEMAQQLVPLGVRVAEGFATTADAYREYLDFNGLSEKNPPPLRGSMNRTWLNSHGWEVPFER